MNDQCSALPGSAEGAVTAGPPSMQRADLARAVFAFPSTAAPAYPTVSFRSEPSRLFSIVAITQNWGLQGSQSSAMRSHCRPWDKSHFDPLVCTRVLPLRRSCQFQRTLAAWCECNPQPDLLSADFNGETGRPPRRRW